MSFQLVLRLRSVMNMDTSRCNMSVAEALRSSILNYFFNFYSRNIIGFNL